MAKKIKKEQIPGRFSLSTRRYGNSMINDYEVNALTLFPVSYITDSRD